MVDTNVTSPSGRISRTGQQLGVGTAVSLVAKWIVALTGLDLDPWSDEKGIPGEVMVALVFLVGMSMSWWMNRRSPNPGARAAKKAAAAAKKVG